MSSFYDEIKKLMIEDKKETVPTQKKPKVIKTEVLSEEQKEAHMKLFETLPTVATPKTISSIKRTTVIDILSLNEVKKFLRIDEDDETEDDYIFKMVIPSAVAYVCNYIGLTMEKVATKEDLKSATLIVCGMIFDNRGAMVSSQMKMNPILTSILDMNSVNLL